MPKIRQQSNTAVKQEPITKTKRRSNTFASITPEKRERMLANLIPYEAGKSGNPGGKPKVIKEILQMGYKNTPAIMQRLIDAALNDQNPNVWIPAAREVLNRVLGKPKEQVEAKIEHAFVLRAPPVLSSADEWEAKYGDHPQVIDGAASELPTASPEVLTQCLPSETADQSDVSD